MARDFADHVCDLLAPLGEIGARAMFGGYGIYRDGLMFALIADDVLYFRTDDGNRAAYAQAGMGPFKPWPHKPMVMPYHEVPPDLLEDPGVLCDWARDAVAAALRGRKPKKRR